MTIGRKAPAEMDRAKAQRGMIDKTTPLYVVCSPYRCVGKTLISRLLTEFYVLDDRPVAAYDLADEGPQLTDYLPQFTTVADIGDIFGQMAFFERLIADNEGANIIDLSHRMFQNFFTVAEQIGFFEEARRRSIEPLVMTDMISGQIDLSMFPATVALRSCVRAMSGPMRSRPRPGLRPRPRFRRWTKRACRDSTSPCGGGCGFPRARPTT